MVYKNKVIYLSLTGVAIISLISFLLVSPKSGNQYASIGFSVIMLAGLCLEVIVLLVTGLILYFGGTDKSVTSARKQRANAFFLAIGLVLLVGVSLCFGGVFLYDAW